MRMAVISDIHGNSAALRAVLADIARRDIKQTVNLGDCFSGPLDARGTADLLAQHDLPTVRGNHDRLLFDRPIAEMGQWEAWVIDDLSPSTIEWCRALPLTREINQTLLCHATPNSDDKNWLDHRTMSHRLTARDLAEVEKHAEGVVQSLILCGHTHTPRSVQLPDGRRIVNPGSVGCPGYFDTRSSPPFVHQTGSADARYAIVERLDNDWAVQLIGVPYDASEMIQMAREKSAGTWAQALETGWFA